MKYTQQNTKKMRLEFTIPLLGDYLGGEIWTPKCRAALDRFS